MLLSQVNSGTKPTASWKLGPSRRASRATSDIDGLRDGLVAIFSLGGLLADAEHRADL